jgi:alpha-L-rhamnosidase
MRPASRRWTFRPNFLVALLSAAALASASAATAGLASAGGLPISEDTLRSRWKAAWLACPGAPERDAGVFRFRKVLELPRLPEHYIVHVSGDQRFVLHVNGRRVGVGPARGDVPFWRFETFDLAPFLQPGRNLVSALVWNFGTQAPGAQVTLRTGFVLQGNGREEQAANTDTSWQCAVEDGHQPWPEGARVLREQAHQYFVVGPGERLDAALYDWDWARLPDPGETGGWSPAVAYDRPSPRTIAEGPGYGLSPEGRLLVPDELPAMEYRLVPAGSVVRASGVAASLQFPDASLTIPPHTKASLLLDRRELVTAYPELTFSSGRGSRLVLTYQEALVGQGFRKGNRDEIAGKRLLGYSDEVRPDGGARRVFHTLWWRTWRYLQLDAETGDEPLVIDSLAAHATGYPFEASSRLQTGDTGIDRILEVGWRTARLCAHETYFDCPYYEQYQYVGDTRIQALISYTNAGDDRLARQAISAFERSRRSDGLTSSRYPAAEPQYIPPFSLLWIGMVRDFWMYRDDPAFVRAQLPGTRTVLDWFLERQLSSGLLGRTPWWSYLDWATDFDGGVPPMEPDGQSAPLTLQLVAALGEAAALEQAFGDAHRADVYRMKARAAADAVFRLCWDERRGMVADRPSRDRFSQQTNILAILTDAVPAARQGAVLERVLAAGMPTARGAERGAGAGLPQSRPTLASYYFRFYLARALDKLGRGDDYLPQLEPWREMLRLGLSTWAEAPFENARSDCHAWSAHPNYDLLTIVAGIRPGSPGFRTVRIEPHLGVLDRLQATMPHPTGTISVSYQRKGDGLEAQVVLPAGVSGELAWRGRTRALQPGTQALTLE